MEKRINIKETLSTIISTGTSVNLLMEDIRKMKGNSFVLDFTGVSIISRSFASNMIYNLETDKINYKIVNANPVIISIISAVKKSLANSKRKFKDIQVLNLSDDELQEFLVSM